MMMAVLGSSRRFDGLVHRDTCFGNHTPSTATSSKDDLRQVPAEWYSRPSNFTLSKTLHTRRLRNPPTIIVIGSAQ